LPLERRLPVAVFGPVLRYALARLAAICLSVAMGNVTREDEDRCAVYGLSISTDALRRHSRSA
jgi:hypothetical protein